MAGGIRDWLEGIGLAEYYDAFVENAVDQALLPHLAYAVCALLVMPLVFLARRPPVST